MNKDKVYLKGYVIGRAADTLGYQGLMVQLENLDVVEIDKNLVHKEVDEPQKPVVPQFVADWYEENKNNLDKNIYDCIVGWGIHSKEIRDWMRETSPFQTLVNMHQFGYTVEKEKRYLVKMNGVKDIMGFLNFGGITKLWFMGDEKNLYGCRTHHTRKELEEAGFGEVFNSSLFEVEEAEE